MEPHPDLATPEPACSPDRPPLALTLESFRSGASLLRMGLKGLILAQAGALALALLFIGWMFEIGCNPGNLRFLLWLLAGLILALFLPFVGWLQQHTPAYRADAPMLQRCAKRRRLKRLLAALVLIDLALFAVGSTNLLAGLASNSIVTCDMDGTPSGYHI